MRRWNEGGGQQFMKIALAIGAIGGLLIYGAQPGEQAASPAVASAPEPPLDWSSFAEGFGGPAAREIAQRIDDEPEAAAELDVVDAHWMALTMWGEARGDGEAGMRAVGHVIDNRRRAKRQGAYVTDTVSEAWQFSCWNPGDPNRAAMLEVDALPRDGRDYRLWLAARRIADEILAGRSADPTGGALFYHVEGLSPDWSAGLTPDRRIGRHVFFHTARSA